mmetsp:Transcript_111452/g.240138  ORF Transcript_111452/g.240138 Transcript_111452/m.240138 type:complete len:393 (-) Transcript_111452:66-1244(-)
MRTAVAPSLPKPAGTSGSIRTSSSRPLKPAVGLSAQLSSGGHQHGGHQSAGHSAHAATTHGKAAVDELGRVVSTPLAFGSCDIPPVRFAGTNFTVSTFQHIGDRRTQEDRFSVVPHFEPEKGLPCSFFGVFDGTVGDFASENVKELVVPKLLASPHWKALSKAAPRSAEQDRLLKEVVLSMYSGVDEALIRRCAENTQHYATCTSVTIMIVGDALVVGHLGDSRIILGKADGHKGELVGEQLTQDHKPDLDDERQRIERCGGMVERLQNHSNKPFIRGGDFMMRKALGEQPMQLQYSRAFGAKDLKMFGLSCIPDVKVIRAGSAQCRHPRYVILASDGLWDILSSQQAVDGAAQAVQEDLNPAEALVRLALMEQSRRKGRADNITATVIQFD